MDNFTTIFFLEISHHCLSVLGRAWGQNRCLASALCSCNRLQPQRKQNRTVILIILADFAATAHRVVDLTNWWTMNPKSWLDLSSRLPDFKWIGSGVSEPQVAENDHLPLTWHIALTTVYALTCYTLMTLDSKVYAFPMFLQSQPKSTSLHLSTSI